MTRSRNTSINLNPSLSEKGQKTISSIAELGHVIASAVVTLV